MTPKSLLCSDLFTVHEIGSEQPQCDDLPALPSCAFTDSHSGMVLVNGEVLVCGGPNRKPSDQVFLLNADRQWSRLRNAMNTSRSNAAACAVDNVVYVVGGENQFGALSSVETTKWSDDILASGIKPSMGLDFDGSI